MNLKKFLLPFLSQLICLTTFAQLSTLSDYQKKYKGHNAVFLKKNVFTTIKLKKKSFIDIRSEEEEEMMILSEAGIRYGQKSLYSDSFIASEIMDAYTLGTDRQKTKATDISTKSDMGSYSFYDDRKSTVINFPSLNPGAVTHIKSMTNFKEPKFFGAEFISSFIPVEEMQIKIKCSKKINLHYQVFNGKGSDIEFTKTEKGKNYIYTWKIKNIPEYKFESDAPNVRYYAPHILFRINSFHKKDSLKNLLSNPADLYNWYKELTKNVNQKTDEKIKHIVDSLCTGKLTELEKVKSIFYWVQDQVKYIAFEDGLGGFIPREASSVCEKRFGDCKDMASTIQYMLKLAGIPAYLTWIGTRDIPYTYNEVPTSHSDNHMIATYIDPKGHYYFLDATGKNARLGMHTSMIQGKEALLGKGETFEIVRVPEIPKEQNYQYDSVYMQLKENKLMGKGKMQLNGYQKIFIDSRLKQLNQDDKEKFMKAFLEKGNNKFNVDSFIVAHEEDKESATEVNYEFSLQDYTSKNDKEEFINLNMDKAEISQIINTEQRQVPKEFDYKKTERTVLYFQLPPGYQCTYLPPAAEYKGNHFGFSINYKKVNHAIVMEKIFYINQLLLAPEQFNDWNKMLKELNKAYQETLVIKN